MFPVQALSEQLLLLKNTTKIFIIFILFSGISTCWAKTNDSCDKNVGATSDASDASDAKRKYKQYFIYIKFNN